MGNTILLKGRGIRTEAVAGGAITPGHLVALNSTGKLVVHPTAGGLAVPTFAVENDLEGKDIADAYATNDYVQAETLYSGCEVLARVAAGAAAIAKGAYLQSAGDGTLQNRAAGTPGSAFPGIGIAQALEAVDNSGGGTVVTIKVVIL